LKRRDKSNVGPTNSGKDTRPLEGKLKRKGLISGNTIPKPPVGRTFFSLLKGVNEKN